MIEEILGEGVLCQVLVWGCYLLEMALCYRLLYIGWMDWEDRSGLEKAVFGGVVLTGATFAVICGGENTVSFGITVVQAALVCASFCCPGIRKKLPGDFLAGITLVLGYFTVMSLLNFMLAFLMSHTVQGDSSFALEILACSDALILGAQSKIKIEEYRFREVVARYKSSLLLLIFEAAVVLGVFDVIYDECGENLADMEAMTGAAVVLGMLVLVLFLAFCIFLWEDRTAQEMEFAAEKERMLEENYQRLSELMQENRENVHDMKHHIHVMQELSEKSENGELRQYLGGLGTYVFRGEQMAWTASRILNTILNQRQEEAAHKGIAFKVEADTNFQLPLNDREICAVFSNLLDNAIEACTKKENGERWIHMSLEQREEMAFVTIENSFAGTLDFRNGMPVSGKKDEKHHGLGLKSVRRSVKQHGGDLMLEAEDQVFRVNLSFFS